MSVNITKTTFTNISDGFALLNAEMLGIFETVKSMSHDVDSVFHHLDNDSKLLARISDGYTTSVAINSFGNLVDSDSVGMDFKNLYLRFLSYIS